MLTAIFISAQNVRLLEEKYRVNKIKNRGRCRIKVLKLWNRNLL